MGFSGPVIVLKAIKRPLKGHVRAKGPQGRSGGALLPHTPPASAPLAPMPGPWAGAPSLNVDLDPGGYLEDLGLILAILAIMVNPSEIP